MNPVSLNLYSSILFCPQALKFYSRQSYQNKATPSAGLLFVFIEQADGLPVSLLLLILRMMVVIAHNN